MNTLINKLTTMINNNETMTAIKVVLKNENKDKYDQEEKTQLLKVISTKKPDFINELNIFIDLLSNRHAEQPVVMTQPEPQPEPEQTTTEAGTVMVRAYLRASTSEQDATRAKGELLHFANKHNKRIAAFYTENKSGASLDRPELDKLIDESEAGDILLVESADRLSRLEKADLDVLKAKIKKAGLIIVVADIPTTHNAMRNNNEFEGMDSIVELVVNMIADLVLEIAFNYARKDYDLRKKRQAQGIKKALEQGKFKGKAEDVERNNVIMQMLMDGMSWKNIQTATGAAKGTLAKLSKRIKENAELIK